MIRRLSARVGLVLLAILLVAASHATAAPPGPVLSVTASSQPTNFAPGSDSSSPFEVPLYSYVITNVGGATTSEPITVTDVLPPSLTPSGAVSSVQGSFVNEPCEIVAQTVTCTNAEPLTPGAWLLVQIPVAVAADAPPSVTHEVTVAGGGSPSASTTATTAIGSSPAEFGFLTAPNGLGLSVTPQAGAASLQAGSHPYQMTIEVGLPSADTGEGEGEIANALTSAGHLRDLTLNLPKGVVVNPNATTVRCTEAQLEGEGCPDASQVGTVTILTSVTTTVPSVAGLYNMVPPDGAPASLGFNALGLGIYVHTIGGVRTGEDYGLSASTGDILARARNPIYNVQAQLWGDPSASSHDFARGDCVIFGGSCPTTPTATPLLTMPSSCASSLTVTAAASSWEEPTREVSGSAQAREAGSGAAAVSGCERLGFSPGITLRPDVSTAETPSGLRVNLHIPQTDGLETLATANLKDAKVTLPVGVAVSPSAANGLAACASDQIELDGPAPARCPDAAKIGTVEVSTPLLDHTLPGAVYVAQPQQNPFGSLLAIYIAVHDPRSGVVIKLAGHVEADPVTGQLTTTFEENPELPFEDFDLDFFGGPRAALQTPATCGAFGSEGEFTPWSGTAPVRTLDSFSILAGAGGVGCPAGLAGRPNNPSFSAGTVSPAAGAFSPFVLRLGRADGSQELKRIDAILPPGLTGKLAGVPYCPEAALAVAAGRSGRDELATPSCRAASEVGSVNVGAGPGPQPYHVTGRIYLTGPYAGAPIGLAIVTPAVAGPYDLGTVVVRSALRINPVTAQIRAVSDPIPTILQGIPLDVRSVAVDVDRPRFTLNPTSCEEMTVGGVATSIFDQVATLSDRFQMGGCGDLGFRPRLSLRLKGPARRAKNPKLIATLRARSGDANIDRAQVTLPRSAFLDQSHIRTICTRVQFAAENCPKGSVYGRARATTPLLDHPLVGPVYLRSSNNPLPDLVADLRGPAQQPIRIELVGRTDAVRGALRNTFDVVPDAPVERFRLELFGGKRGLVVNSRDDICRRLYHATVRLRAHNGAHHDFRPAVQSDCGKNRRRSSGRR